VKNGTNRFEALVRPAPVRVSGRARWGCDVTKMWFELLVDAGLSARVFVNEQLVPVSYLQLARAKRQQDLILTPANARPEPSGGDAA